MSQNIKLNFIYNSIYQIAAIVIPVITTPYVSRVLGADGIGEYSYAFSIAYYFMLFIKLGLNNYGNRIVASLRDDRAKLSQTFFSIFVMQILMLILFTGLYVIYVQGFATNKTLAYILVLYVISAGIDITWFFAGLEEFRLTVIRDFIIKIVTTICIFIFVNADNDTWKYTLILSLGASLSQLFLWLGIKSRIDIVIPKWKDISQHIKPNLILFIPVVAVSLYNTMDKIMLGSMVGSKEVGFYESSEKIIKIPVALVNSLGTVMLPRMANLYSNGTRNDEANGLINKSIIFVMFLSTSIGFGIMTIANQFVPLFYGDGFEKCISLFYVLLPSCIFMSFANVIRTQYLIPQRMDRVYIISVFVGAGTNLIANYLLIPQFQSIGAAIGTLIAEISVCVVQIMAVSKKLDIKKYVYEASPFIIAGVLMFVTFREFRIPELHTVASLMIKIFLAGGVYLIVLCLLIFLYNRINPGMFNIYNVINKILLKARKR
ncbi:flippase [Caldibacillus lycopersici]|uniref:Flippase n=1 Tax=Perspicuibacillus lycopersici TaxID=1325689 RepID=A0AAE3IS32_9BACI|nr:flippase [Perspicuibacillus lycopersici]MCU9613187.1 flippase [Perspicuibacillus lycopersici]